MTARVAVVTVAHDTRDDVLRCLASLRACALPLETVVVDNASGDGTPAAVAAAFPDARVVANAENRGFAAACNQGAAATTAEAVLFLNSDAEARPGAVEALHGLLAARPEVGAVGPRTVFPDGTVQVSFGPDLTPAAEWRQRRLVRGVRRRDPRALREAEAAAAREHEPDWLSGACLMVRRAAFAAVGGFDEGFFLYEEDADLCRRLRAAGWRVLYTPAAEVVHGLGRSMARASARAADAYHRSHLRYYRKHNGPLATLGLRALLALRGRFRVALSG
ncbi:MAG TPA: glycosyltransferase family 2 protein [Vicinamibacteria bacterium]